MIFTGTPLACHPFTQRDGDSVPVIRKILLILALLIPVAAHADVTYTFVPTSYSGAGASPLPFTLSFDLTNAAVQKGSFSLTQQPLSIWIWSGDSGLNSLSATAPNLNDFFGANGGSLHMNLAFNAKGGIETSGLQFFDPGGSQELSGGGKGNDASFAFSSDNGGYCRFSYECSVSGHWTQKDTPVPEPMSAALFGTALMGLGLIRRAIV